MKKKSSSTGSLTGLPSTSSGSGNGNVVRVCLRSKWGYDHAIRRMNDGTLYELHKTSFTEIQARHLKELAAQEPFLFHEKIFSGELRHGNDH